GAGVVVTDLKAAQKHFRHCHVEVGVARTVDILVQPQHRSRIVVLRMNPGGDVSQRIDDGNITAQGCGGRAGVELEACLQEEGLGGEAQNETPIGKRVCEAIPYISERQDRVPDSRSRGILEVIVIGVPKKGIPRTASLKVNVDAVKSEGCNQVEYRIDESVPVRIRIEFEGSACRAAD